MIGLKNGLFTFQEECVDYLLEIVKDNKKKCTIVKSPTGSGKTIILLDFIDKYLNTVNPNTVFIWLCPGKGDLEEQSRKKMLKYLPQRSCKRLFEVLNGNFEEEDTVFINWELITNKKNKAITETEKKNLFDKIAVAHRSNIEFILIVDEEHSNNTKKAEYMINAFAPTHELRVSATTKENTLYNYYEIDEMDVIDAGLITKALYINEDIDDNIKIDNEHEYLIKLADAKRSAINRRYKEINKKIRPLVLIQFPDSSNILIEDVENMLECMGYTYENKMVAKWMSDADDKINIEGIEENDAYPIFLLMKQAISTGWDCPRAKILIKLREKMDEDFTIQTIGRLRRMPESVHYEDVLLDNCFLYTFDEDYKQSVMHDITNSFQRKTVFLKEKCKTFTLQKEIKDEALQGLGERETCQIVYKHFVEKYGLKKSSANNELKFKEGKYKFDEELLSYARKGEFINTESILDSKQGEVIRTYREVDTHKNGVDLWSSINKIRNGIGLSYDTTRAIINRLFTNSMQDKHNILELNKSQSYAFIINNVDLLKRDFKEALSGKVVPNVLKVFKYSTFRIPEMDKIKFDAAYRDAVLVESNAYDEYYSSVWVKKIRSYPESKFEEYCEGNSRVDWVYKNGDSGSDYFSIVYTDLNNKQWYFYPDYIVKLKNGEVWIIEAKGGESDSGETKNIDLQAENKFNQLKRYATAHNLRWGFVRDKHHQLKINNTEYTENMDNDNWKPISTAF